ncbi:MAG: AIPR family protein [Treponema sp.]|nr:AIPR family protein [Treponema sp.]
METDFYRVAYLPPDTCNKLSYIINDKYDGNLVKRLSEIYNKDTSSFHEGDDFAYIDTGLHYIGGKKLFAYFVPNRIPDKQKWYLAEFKNEDEIEELCASLDVEDSYEPEEKTEKPKKKIIHAPAPIFGIETVKPKSSVKSLLDMYRKEHSGNDNRDGVVFERMLTQAIIESDSPNSINNDESILDLICVDDYYDSGIDSICIRVNGHIITSQNFLKFIIEKDKGIRSAEIILIQSKCKDKFDLKEISTFILGVQNFLERDSSRKLNSKVQMWFDIKNEILENVQNWTEMNNITVRPFYAAANATWTNSSEILGSFETLKKTAQRIESGVYSIESPVFIDEMRLQKLALNETKTYSEKIMLQGTPLQLSGDEAVMGCAAIINAKELLKILIDETMGNLKRGLFEENVRDYQGNTNVNLSIKETIKTAPESFILRNNGITILGSRLEYPNLNSVRITNPQIVNGCQTCSVIYYAHKEGLDLSKVNVFARIISTSDSETINSIVSANNNQNVVHDMINEITKGYHKKLEVFFRNYENTSEQRHVYYERRSKSLANENICAYQKCTFRTMLQSAVAIWFDAPHDAVSSEYELLAKYKNQIFSDNHSELCYYASASLYSAFDLLIYQNRLNSEWRSAKPFICYLVKRSIAPAKISLNDTAQAEEVASSILSLCRDEYRLEDAFENALSIFVKAKKIFADKNNGKNISFYFNNPKVMPYIIGAISKKSEDDESQQKHSTTYSGRIFKIGRDRYGRTYLFISSGSDSVFAHEDFSQNFAFSNLQTGQTVIYELTTDRNGKQVAANVHR